jgi:hypothetical protein
MFSVESPGVATIGTACLAAFSFLACSDSSTGGESHRVGEVQLFGEAFVRREMRANAFHYDEQRAPTVALSSSGGFTIAWESRRQQAGCSAVCAQQFDPAGRRRGDERRAAVAPGTHQTGAALAQVGDATWIAWEAFEPGGSGSAVFLRHADDAASAIKIDAVLARQIALAPAGDGLLAAWVNADGDFERVFVARFDASGEPISAPRAFGAGDENAHLPSLAALEDGGCAIVWAARDARRRPCGLRVAVCDADGAQRAAVREVCGTGPAASIEPRIAARAEGGFVLAWHDGGGRGGYDVLAQVFDASGAPASAVLLVSAAQRHQSGAAVAAARDGSGRFVVAWNVAEGDDGKVRDVCARLYRGAGEPLGEPFVVTAHARGDQELAVATNGAPVAFGAAGQLVFAWSGQGDLGDDRGVHATVLTPRSSPLAAACADRTPDPAAEPRPERPLLATGRLEDIDTRAIAARAPTVRAEAPPIFTGHVAQREVPSLVPLADFGFTGVTNTGWRPPDTIATVGPKHVVELVNGGFAIYTKTGTRTFFSDLNSFWSPVGSQNFVFDPRVIFDPHSGRFFAICTEHVGTVSGWFVLAVSDDDDPNGVWYKYRFDATADAGGYFVDFPHLGIDERAIYLTSNNFSGSFTHMVWILDKAPLLDGRQPPTRGLIKNSGTTASLAMGAQYGPAPAAYGVNTSGSNIVRIFAIQNPLTTPTLSTFSLTVPSFAGGPADAPQIGTTQLLDSIDKRFSRTVYRNKRLYCAHNYASTPTKARWYEIEIGDWPVSGTPQLLQSGDVDLGAAYGIIPSVAADPYGNILVTCTRSAADETPSVVRASRTAADPPGTLPSVAIALQSPVSYTRTRWGDYSGVALDPRDQATFWYCHEYALDDLNWATWIGSKRVQPPTFTQDRTSISASGGGTVNFAIDNPPWAGQIYYILVGASGRTPGFRLPSPPSVINVDLNPDSLTIAAALSPLLPPFANFAGVLDASGKANAAFSLPALPLLFGLDFQFAVVQYDGSAWNYASQTLTVTMAQ